MNKRKNRSLMSFGNSMYPIFWDKDTVIVEEINKSQLRVDDVVTIDNKSHYITHRVIYINPKNGIIITKGDNNFYTDKAVSFDRIVGKVTKIKRNGESLALNDFYLLHSTIYFNEILRIKEDLKRAKIKFVFLKGLPLYLYYEKQHPNRSYGDCDILVDIKNNQIVRSIFKSNGYNIKNFSPKNMYPSDKESQSEYTFFKRVGMFEVMFDIHLSLSFLSSKLDSLDSLYSKELSTQFTCKLLREKRDVSIQGHTFPILREENLLIYLALHLYHHNLRGYHRYMMINTIINSGHPDQKILSKLVRMFEIENFVYPVFALLIEYYSPKKINKGFLKKISPRAAFMPFVNQLIKNTNIFEGENVIDVIIKKYYLAYNLTSVPLWKKVRFFMYFSAVALLHLNPNFLANAVNYIVARKILRKFVF